MLIAQWIPTAAVVGQRETSNGGSGALALIIGTRDSFVRAEGCVDGRGKRHGVVDSQPRNASAAYI